MRAIRILAMPLYVVGAVVGVCRFAVREAMREYRLQQHAKEAARVYVADVKAGRARDWSMN